MHGTSGQQKSQLWLANTILETETPPAMRADVYYAQKSCDHIDTADTYCVQQEKSYYLPFVNKSMLLNFNDFSNLSYFSRFFIF